MVTSNENENEVTTKEALDAAKAYLAGIDWLMTDSSLPLHPSARLGWIIDTVISHDPPVLFWQAHLQRLVTTLESMLELDPLWSLYGETGADSTNETS